MMARKSTPGKQEDLQKLRLENDLLHESLRQAQRVHQLYCKSIDKLKAAEEEVKRSELLKSGIMDSALDCIISMDEEGRIVEFNGAAETVFGHARADTLGKSLAELIIPPSLRKKHNQGLSRHLATEEGAWLNKRVETTAIRADGSEFPVEISITEILHSGTKMFTGFIRDVTERKKAEEALNEKLDEVERMNRLMVGRELKMEELRREIKRLHSDVAVLRSKQDTT